MRLSPWPHLALVSTLLAFSVPSPAQGRHIRVAASADLQSRARKLRRTLPDSFTVVVAEPFVVIGNDRPEEVQRRARSTVRWAVGRLKKDYFSRDPVEIIEIYLFRDARSYKHYAKKWFGDEPDTPYGYYSPSDRALIMDISTGGGTLVHEIVHPFMATNFPNCPAWFNEGLGSLYEASSERGGKIVGTLNWRLPGLQKAIRAKALPSFERLMQMSDGEFYSSPKGDNYAQARYLLYYLQEKGLLRRFYRQFRRHRRRDPSGYQTLVKILGHPDMGRFEKSWKAQMLGLHWR